MWNAMKFKRTASIVLSCAIMLCSLCACEPVYDEFNGSAEKNAAMTVALNTVVFAASYFDSDIHLIKSDNYGRALYWFDDRSEPTVEGVEEGQSYCEISLIVVQNNTETDVSYYENDCYLNLHSILNFRYDHSESQRNHILINYCDDSMLEEFLNANDWNDPLMHNEKCTTKEIVRTKISGNLEKEFKKIDFQKTYQTLYPEHSYVNLLPKSYLTSDKYERHIFVFYADYSCILEDVPYYFVAYQDNAIIDYTDFENRYTYRDALTTFKDKIGWNQPK